MPELSEEEINAALQKARTDKAAVIAAKQREEARAAIEADLRTPWNSEQLFRYIQSRAVNNYNMELLIDDSNREVIKMLNRYFTADVRFETMGEGYSLQKGLLLMGNVGTGKSTLMQLYGRNKRQCYNMISCRTIGKLFAADGHGVFDAYRGPRQEPMNDPNVFYQRQIGYCFDDLGTEESKNHMGNKVNVMADIILNRYDEKFRYPLVQTHITTNLTAEEIEECYGTRVRSRFREMFNVIVLDGEDRRK